MQTKHEWEERVELNPDQWFRYDVYSEVWLSTEWLLTILQMDKVREKMANYVGVETEDLAFVENASAGANAVLRSLQPTLKPGAKMLILGCHLRKIRTKLAKILRMAW